MRRSARRPAPSSLGDALSAGTLTFTNAGLFSSSRGFTLGAGGGVFNTTGALVTLSGGVGGTGGLTKIGDGVLELTGASSLCGLDGDRRRHASRRRVERVRQPAARWSSARARPRIFNGFNQSVGSIGGTGSILLGRGTLTTGSDNSSSLFAGAISGAGRSSRPAAARSS